MRRGLFFILLWVVSPFFAFGGERGGETIVKGDLRLTIYPRVGLFALHILDADGRFRSFLDDSNLGSSLLGVELGGQRHWLGWDTRFSVQTIKEDDHAIFLWTGRDVEIEETIGFLGNQEGFFLRVTVSNNSHRPVEAGVVFLADTRTYPTWSREGFFSPETGVFYKERDTDHPTMTLPTYWSSSSDKWRSTLKYLLVGEGIESPERVVFANWNILRNSDRRLVTIPGRSFENRPFFPSDGAAKMFYKRTLLWPAKKRTVEIHILKTVPVASGKMKLIPVSKETPSNESSHIPMPPITPDQSSLEVAPPFPPLQEETPPLPASDRSFLAAPLPFPPLEKTQEETPPLPASDQSFLAAPLPFPPFVPMTDGQGVGDYDWNLIYDLEKEIVAIKRYKAILEEYIKNGIPVAPEDIERYGKMLRKFEEKKQKIYGKGTE